ncbi:MAG: HPr family phosphocarrier protein [Candidatus Dadabacteria bacterium]|nr:HPr family phosphocarrier protein [Candidatus Dadabacteria bacterium]
MSQKPLVRNFVIRNRLGLHARAAAVLVALTSRFSSSIMIKKDSFEIDGKSILGVLSLAAICGTEVAITIEGEDSKLAMEEVSRLIESGFGEGVDPEN